tara:strand:- start:327 stop:1250 length:924 start_codon:yes stop_codon:yes gene_type:complete
MTYTAIPNWLKGKYVDEISPRREVNKCPWCGSEKKSKWGNIVRGFLANECLECNLVYIANPLSSEAQSLYYEHYPKLVHQLKDDDRDPKEHGKSTIANRNIMYDLEAKSILKCHKRYKEDLSGLKILDVGCAGGQFLDSFKKYGLKTYGIDLIDQNSAEHNLLKGSFLEYQFKQKFDFITFRGVMEHLEAPKTFLERSFDLLADPDSIVAITSTPNLSSPAAQFFKEKWTLHGPESHILHLSPDHFHKYFESRGFRCIKEEYPYSSTPYSSFKEDIKIFADFLNNQDNYEKSPPFFESMMTLCFEKI